MTKTDVKSNKINIIIIIFGKYLQYIKEVEHQRVKSFPDDKVLNVFLFKRTIYCYECGFLCKPYLFRFKMHIYANFE